VKMYIYFSDFDNVWNQFLLRLSENSSDASFILFGRAYVSFLPFHFWEAATNRRKTCQGNSVVPEPKICMICQKTLSGMTYVRRCILVMQSPGVKFWPPSENGESQSLQNFSIVMLIHFSIFGDVFIVNSYHRIILSACWPSLRFLIILDWVSASFKLLESLKLLNTTPAIIIKKRF
jgi:hypothetical protein